MDFDEKKTTQITVHMGPELHRRVTLLSGPVSPSSSEYVRDLIIKEILRKECDYTLLHDVFGDKNSNNSNGTGENS